MEKYRPAAIWLSVAKDLKEYTVWADALRKVSPDSGIWIQVGNVASAKEVAVATKPDVVIAQGLDAGGHGLEKGAGVITLVPEIADTFRSLGDAAPTLLASGGIVDGRGLAAVLTLGAEGAVMGTRFLGSEEATLHQNYQAAIIGVSDGGQATARDKVFDLLRGPNPWPDAYDGRSIISESYIDLKNGRDIDEIRKLHQEAVSQADRGFGQTAGEGRAAIWAGTGIGLVQKVQKAGDIVEEVRDQARMAIHHVL